LVFFTFLAGDLAVLGAALFVFGEAFADVLEVTLASSPPFSALESASGLPDFFTFLLTIFFLTTFFRGDAVDESEASPSPTLSLPEIDVVIFFLTTFFLITFFVFRGASETALASPSFVATWDFAFVRVERRGWSISSWPSILFVENNVDGQYAAIYFDIGGGNADFFS
jgi:hypothetical protein